MARGNRCHGHVEPGPESSHTMTRETVRSFRGTIRFSCSKPSGVTDASRRPQPNKPQEQTGGCCRGSALKRLALLENSCQRRSEDFVPPAAQRRLVRRSKTQSAPIYGGASPSSRLASVLISAIRGRTFQLSVLMRASKTTASPCVGSMRVPGTEAYRCARRKLLAAYALCLHPGSGAEPVRTARISRLECTRVGNLPIFRYRYRDVSPRA